MYAFNYRETLGAGVAQAGGARFVEQRRTPRARAGFQRGMREGASLEYKDFREYQPGDDLRWIDWNAYARTDKLIVKRFHEEVTPHVDLLVDGSASMNLDESRKAEALIQLTGFFAGVARNSSYSCTCFRAAEDCRPLDNSGEDVLHWPQIDLSGAVSPGVGVLRNLSQLKRQGVRVLLSDLLWLGSPREFLAKLAQDAAAVMVVQVLAAADMDPGVGGLRRIIDAETGREREVHLDETARQAYLAAFNRHQDAWRQAARETGVLLFSLEAEAALRRPIADQLPAAGLLAW